VRGRITLSLMRVQEGSRRKGQGIRFSLILATVGRRHEVRTFLDSLSAQSYRNFELVVVDQNDDDRISSLLASYSNKFHIKHVRAKKGLSRARNVGLRNSEADVIAFPDDDCEYLPNTLERVERFFAERPGIDGLTGRSVDKNGNVSSGGCDSKGGFIGVYNVWNRGVSIAIFLRTEIVRGLEFDESLGAGAKTRWGSGEETDYLLNVLKCGGKLYYDPTLCVLHPQVMLPYDREALRKAYVYGCGMGRVLSKHEMPLRFKLKWLTRSLGGAVLSLTKFQTFGAAYYWNTFRGRLRGML
jgi:glycosyltransferase involved in cell wall biosynthesis